MFGVRFKRIAAYFIDMMIVTALCNLLFQVSFLNPHVNKYDEVYDEYYNYILDISEDPNSINLGEYENNVKHYTYLISKYSVSFGVIEIVICFLYFTFFPIFNKNRTIGKHIMRIHVVDRKNENVPLIKHGLRSLLLPICSSLSFTNVIVLLATNLTVLFTNENGFYSFMQVITPIMLIYTFIDVLCMLNNRVKRPLHDVILGLDVEKY